MKKKSMWSFKLGTAALVLIPSAVAINFIGKLISSTLKLPLWLDSIGTILSGFIAGPVVGGLVGLLTNIVLGLSDPIALVYGITSMCIGIVAGVMAMKYPKKDLKWILITGLFIGLTAIVVSTPLNIIFWEGQTGNVVGDTVFVWARSAGMSLPVASLLDEIVIDIPDKIITVFIVYGLYKVIPESLLLLFQNNEEIESLD